MRRTRKLLAVALVSSLIFTAAPALANEHDSESAGHPLRIVAYILHPVGFILDTLIFRPADWFVSLKPLDKLFGHKD